MVLTCVLGFGALCAIAEFATVKWYFPQLRRKETADDAAAPAVGANNTFPFKYILIIAITVAITMLCAYFSAKRGDYLLDVQKMMVGLIVLGMTALTDIEFHLIPNLFSVILIADRLITIVIEIVLKRDYVVSGIVSSLLAGVVCLVFLLIMSKVTRGGLGLGDVKILSSLGFLCGVFAILYTVIFSLFLCAIGSVVLLLLKKKSVKDDLPFGPFIMLGFALSIALALC